MAISRRDFLKNTAAAVALSSLTGISTEAKTQLNEDKNELLKGTKTFKAPCRFCGTGCGVQIHTKEGKIIMTEGDPKAPVNMGLNCIKGYNLSKVLYGKERILYPEIRKNGKLERVSWDEAINYIADRYKKVLKEKGPKAVAIAGSGQWTIPEGYVAAKFMKAGLKSNNIDPNARYCMASAVAAFIRTFQADEPMGSYADFEHADVFVTWGANMAEMHPILFSRLVAQKETTGAILFDLTTRESRTSDEAESVLVFKPQTDLAILNAIANYIVANDLYDKKFVEKNTRIKMAQIEPGYGIDPISAPHLAAMENAQRGRKKAGAGTPMTFDQYKNFLATYTFDYASKISGVPADKIKKLAQAYADPSLKVMSLWTMGFNQHTRGVWCNHLIYNIHLLMGKISEPGNGPFSLTGQPSACGTAREVGTFAHKLPIGVVMKKAHREIAAKIWLGDAKKENEIPSKPGFHMTKMMREFERGNLDIMWVQCCNPFTASPNISRFRDRSLNKDSMLIVSDSYRTASTDLADVVLPAAMWVEKEGFYGNAERRTQHWFQATLPPGEAKEDMWHILAVAEKLGLGHMFPDKDDPQRVKKIFEEYRQFKTGSSKDLAPYEEYVKARGLCWPVVQDKKTGEWKETLWRYNAKYDPYASKALGGKKEGIVFYKAKGKKATMWCCPYEPASEVPDNDYPFWLCTGRVLEHWHTGSMTARIPALHRAVPYAKLEMHPEDAKKLGVKRGEKVKISSRRGTAFYEVDTHGRGRPQKGLVYVPFFDENNPINMLTLDHYDPISKEPDYKKCAVKIEKA
ncbi:MAG: molybdopterin-dependent oxidoreductase [Candidatus Cloacimonetes bacterium]|nr:molybdopterin-dependent oxidoreductase [Candidatus Cloacimonadota bacterium]